MTRETLGGLVSRILAVWMVMDAVGVLCQMSIALTSNVEDYRSQNGRLLLVAGTRLGIAAWLWFGAGSFGKWAGEGDTSSESVTWSKSTVFTVGMQAVALYWLVTGLVQLAESNLFRPGPSADIPWFVLRLADGTGSLILTAVALGLLFSARWIGSRI